MKKRLSIERQVGKPYLGCCGYLLNGLNITRWGDKLLCL